MKQLRFFLSTAIPLWAGYLIYVNWDQVKGFLVAGLLTGLILLVLGAILRSYRARQVKPDYPLPPRIPVPTMRDNSSAWYGQQPPTPGGLVHSQEPTARWVDLPTGKYET